MIMSECNPETVPCPRCLNERNDFRCGLCRHTKRIPLAIAVEYALSPDFWTARRIGYAHCYAPHPPTAKLPFPFEDFPCAGAQDPRCLWAPSVTDHPHG